MKFDYFYITFEGYNDPHHYTKEMFIDNVESVKFLENNDGEFFLLINDKIKIGCSGVFIDIEHVKE